MWQYEIDNHDFSAQSEQGLPTDHLVVRNLQENQGKIKSLEIELLEE